MLNFKKPADPWLYVFVIGLIGLFWWAAVAEWGIAHKQLRDLTRITGKIKFVAQRRSDTKSRAYLVVVTVLKTNLDSIKLGKGFGDNRHAAQALADALQKGSEVVAYYNPAAGVDDDFSYNLYQLEANGAVVYDIDQMHDDATGQAVGLTLISILVTVVASYQWIKSQNYFDPNY